MNAFPIQPRNPPHQPAPAFTLVEALIVIGLLGILIGLLAPALVGARSSARQTVSLAHLNTLGKTLHAYTNDNRDRYPFPPERNPEVSGPGSHAYGPVYWTHDDNDQSVSIYFAPVWQMERYWPAIVRDVAPWPEHFATWISPGYVVEYENVPLWRQFVANVSFRYSNAFIAAPRVWTDDPGVTQADIRPTLVTQVRHPSSKVVMHDADRFYLNRPPTHADPRPVLMVDGSAALRLDSDATPGAQNRLSDWSPRLYHDTPNGILGRDF